MYAVDSSHGAILTSKIPRGEAEHSCGLVLQCHLIFWGINSPSTTLCLCHFPVGPDFFFEATDQLLSQDTETYDF